MKAQLIAVMLLGGLLMTGCNKKEKALEAQLSEMQSQMTENQAILENYYQIQNLINSIDMQQELIGKDLKSGESGAQYVQRMENIKKQVVMSREKIADLEKKLNESNQLKGNLEQQLKKFKKELTTKESELALMQKNFEQAKKENVQMTAKIQEQQKSLEALNIAVEVSKNELSTLENQISQLKKTHQISEADSYFARAAALEEVAKRTQMAPKKKKAAYQEAYTFYRMAYDMGKVGAKDKLYELKKKANV